MSLTTTLSYRAEDILKDAFPIIQTGAPILAKAIGGPLGLAIGYAIPILANAFGTHPTNLKQLVNNIISDPNAKDKLASIDAEHGNFIASLITTEDRLIGAEINVKLSWSEPK